MGKKKGQKVKISNYVKYVFLICVKNKISFSERLSLKLEKY